MDKVLAILQQVRADVDFVNEKELIDNGILNSFDIVAIVSELSEAFDITITVDNLIPENFNSAEAIHALVEKILDEE